VCSLKFMLPSTLQNAVCVNQWKGTLLVVLVQCSMVSDAQCKTCRESTCHDFPQEICLMLWHIWKGTFGVWVQGMVSI
jgi:hypothetical protein